MEKNTSFAFNINIKTDQVRYTNHSKVANVNGKYFIHVVYAVSLGILVSKEYNPNTCNNLTE